MSERKKIGLCLGAGGGRGIAHIGVLQVLEEHNVPIDMISGCSAGALVAAIYAAGTDLKLLEHYILTLLPKDILDPTIVTRGGVLSGSKVEEIICTLSHGMNIEDTHIPCYIGATDLETAQYHIFDHCKLHEAARASMAVPGVFTPVCIDGHWYIDGGTLQELPVEVLWNNGADAVIAVDLSIKSPFVVQPGKAPTAHATVLRAFDLMQKTMGRMRNDPVDVRIKPDVSFMGLVSTNGAERAIAIGRACAEAAMPEIEKLLEE